MAKDTHFTGLEKMYLIAPVNAFYQPSINISSGQAEISIAVEPKYCHTAGAVHGSVYFHLLDSAAFFAANSLERDYFVLTSSFTTYLTRPVSEGTMRAIGKVVNETKSQFIVESIAFNAENKEIARGSGIFVRGKTRLSDVPGYAI